MSCKSIQLPARSLCVMVALLLTGQARGDQPLEPIPSYVNGPRPLLENYCLECHSGDAAEAGLSLDRLDGEEGFQRFRKMWQKVARRVEQGEMPPADYGTLSPDEREQLTGWIEARLAEFTCDQPVDPGWVTLRRLNREQYRNTVRDLLGVDFDPTELFPRDELAYGFDNNADILSLTPVLIEKYLDAAHQIARQAIVVPEDLRRPSRRVLKRRWEGGNRQSDDVFGLYTNGTIEFDYNFPTSGRYLLRAVVSPDQAGDEPVQVGLVDQGEVVKRVDLPGADDQWEEIHLELQVEEGKRRLGVAFLNDFYVESTATTPRQDRNLFVRKMEIVGPLEEGMRSLPTAHRKWFATRPTLTEWQHSEQWRGVARDSLERFLLAAYRRPAPDSEVERLLQLADLARRQGSTYEQAMQGVVQAVLVSPRFLFVGYLDPEPTSAEEGGAALVDQFELASRLSYFLWNSTPDAQLLELAAAGRLRNELDAQIDRMLRDARMKRFVASFTGQWLGTRELAEVAPDRELFPDFDEPLREAMAREAELVFADLVRTNASIVNLINADFTYLNDRLAEHYGIPGVQGGHFRRVSLDSLPPEAGVRGGVLTMGGVLTVTSFPTRTAPVLRGKWILGELLGREPPPPPPDIPGLGEPSDGISALSFREQLEKHRESPSCFACHVEMDPLGFALESYDAVGRWRTEDGGRAVDATGELPGGEKLDGIVDLRQALLTRRGEFQRVLIEKMLTYALGRGLEYYDECVVDQIARDLDHNDHRIQSLMKGVIGSEPFQKRRFETRTAEDSP